MLAHWLTFTMLVLGAACKHDAFAPVTDSHGKKMEPWLNNLSSLDEPLMKALPERPFKLHKSENDTVIAQGCYDMIWRENKVYHNSWKFTDFTVYGIEFEEVSCQISKLEDDAHHAQCDFKKRMVMCHHKDSKLSPDKVAKVMSRVPVNVRLFVRNLIIVPGEKLSARTMVGNVLVKGPTSNMLTALIHEVGHNMDAKAYEEHMAKSDEWHTNILKDSKCIDNYGCGSHSEDVAQAHVLAIYHSNVPGGLEKIKGYMDVYNQWYTVIKWARNELLSLKTGTPSQCKRPYPIDPDVDKKTGAPSLDIFPW